MQPGRPPPPLPSAGVAATVRTSRPQPPAASPRAPDTEMPAAPMAGYRRARSAGSERPAQAKRDRPNSAPAPRSRSSSDVTTNALTTALNGNKQAQMWRSCIPTKLVMAGNPTRTRIAAKNKSGTSWAAPSIIPHEPMLPVQQDDVHDDEDDGKHLCGQSFHTPTNCGDSDSLATKWHRRTAGGNAPRQGSTIFSLLLLAHGRRSHLRDEGARTGH